MKNLLKEKKKLIINSDIDGILSGIILQHFLDCEIVGFSNSDDKIWINPHQKKFQKDFVFIDIFVTDSRLACIDQHIVAVNNAHHNILKQNPKKINPNIIRGKYFHPKNSYYSKYPFGTVHFIIANLEKNGYDLSGIQLFSDEELQPIDFILRADDAFYTTKVKYPQNSNDWWKWLISYSNNGDITHQFEKYIQNFDKNPLELKQKIEKTLKNQPYNCSQPDGGFNDILDEKQLKNNFKTYIDFIAQTIGLPTLKINNEWLIYTGKPIRTDLKEEQFDEFINGKINGETIFSYAFVKSYGKNDALSYTLTMNEIK